MKTEISLFWNCFLNMQMDLIAANNVRDLELRDKLFNKLFAKAIKIHPKLRIILYYFPIGTDMAIVIFLTKGNYKLAAVAEEIIAEAPAVYQWQYQIGVKPHKNSIISLCANNKFIDAYTTIYQIYFAIEKVYRTSNKLHLIIFLEMDKKHSKHELHEAMETIFLWFLGDVLYYRHISRFKIIRRKYSAINFIPLDELKNTIQFKSLN